MQKSLQAETRHLSAGKFNVHINRKNIGTGTGLLAMDYGSGTTGCIWTINCNMCFFLWGEGGGGAGGRIISKLTHVFFFMSSLFFFKFFITLVQS